MDLLFFNVLFKEHLKIGRNERIGSRGNWMPLSQKPEQKGGLGYLGEGNEGNRVLQFISLGLLRRSYVLNWTREVHILDPAHTFWIISKLDLKGRKLQRPDVSERQSNLGCTDGCMRHARRTADCFLISVRALDRQIWLFKKSRNVRSLCWCWNEFV